MKAVLSIILGGVLLSSCATSYKPSGMDGGYSETRLAPDVVRITFRGNQYTQKERAQDFALLRAAELCQQAGYSHFTVIDEANDTKTNAIVLPGSSYTSGSFYGNSYSGTSTFVPPQTVITRQPESGLLVKFFKAKPAGGNAFDAAFIVGSIKGKYGL